MVTCAAWLCLNTRADTYMYLHIYIYTYICAYVHTYVYIYTEKDLFTYNVSVQGLETRGTTNRGETPPHAAPLESLQEQRLTLDPKILGMINGQTQRPHPIADRCPVNCVRCCITATYFREEPRRGDHATSREISPFSRDDL